MIAPIRFPSLKLGVADSSVQFVRLCSLLESPQFAAGKIPHMTTLVRFPTVHRSLDKI
jgi:hypothetical protein